MRADKELVKNLKREFEEAKSGDYSFSKANPSR